METIIHGLAGIGVIAIVLTGIGLYLDWRDRNQSIWTDDDDLRAWNDDMLYDDDCPFCNGTKNEQ